MQMSCKLSLDICISSKIIHRDIKPDNIIFSQNYEKPVFIDFGLSDIANESIEFKSLYFSRALPATAQ